MDEMEIHIIVSPFKNEQKDKYDRNISYDANPYSKKLEFTTVIDCPYDESIHGVFEGEFEKEHFKTKFKWDDFQLHSYQAIKRGDNLLVVAPTSSGKTSVARYAALFNLLTKDPSSRVVYTTPINSYVIPLTLDSNKIYYYCSCKI